MIEGFTYTGSATRVLFGTGTIDHLAGEIDRLGLTRVMLIVPSRRGHLLDRLAHALGARVGASFSEAAMHTPIEVTQRAMTVVASKHIDGIVALGGGSTTGLSKAIALRAKIPQIILPTSYAGSEVTPILGETENGRKITKRIPEIVPNVVIYDVDLTLSLSPKMSAASGMNAIAHAAEALYARDGNPITSMMAETGIAALAQALPRILQDPEGRGPRTDALYGAWLCGTCLGSVGMGLHHKLCHTLGGIFNLPHAETHAAVLPHAIAYNSSAAPDAMHKIARALNSKDAPTGLYDLARDLGLSVALRDLRMPKAGIDEAVDAAMSNSYVNPRLLERDAIFALLSQAWQGTRPIQAKTC